MSEPSSCGDEGESPAELGEELLHIVHVQPLDHRLDRLGVIPWGRERFRHLMSSKVVLEGKQTVFDIGCRWQHECRDPKGRRIRTNYCQSLFG